MAAIFALFWYIALVVLCFTIHPLFGIFVVCMMLSTIGQ